MYDKSGTADCCSETDYRDETTAVMNNTGQYSRTSCTECDATSPAQPSSDVDELVRCPERIIRCSVCAAIITSRSDGDVAATNDQSRRGVANSSVHDDVNVPV